MNKKLLLSFVAAIVGIIAVLSLSACSFELDLSGTSTDEYTADTQEDTIELVNMLFEGMLNDANVVVTCENAESSYTQTIKGTSSAYDDGGDVSYVFIKDGKYYKVFTEDGDQYYTESEDEYNADYFILLTAIREEIYNHDDTDEYSCTYTIDEEFKTEGEETVTTSSKGTFTLLLTFEGGSYAVEATVEFGLVKTLKTTLTSDSESDIVCNYTFTYGNAQVDLPDLADIEQY